jgi:hypothetical protein
MAFGLLYKDILKYARFQEYVAHLNKAKHALPMNKSCLQFYYTNEPKHWFLFNIFPCYESDFNVFSITPWDSMTWILDCYKILAFSMTLKFYSALHIDKKLDFLVVHLLWLWPQI